jgi:hypothetical protein
MQTLDLHLQAFPLLHKKSNSRRMPVLSVSSALSRISGICRPKLAGPLRKLIPLLI